MSRSPTRFHYAVGAGVAVLAAVIYGAVLGHGFLNWDDDRFITANPLYAGSTWGYVKAAHTTVQFDAYHPLHLLSYLPDRWLWPTSAAGFHAVNLGIFALDAALLYFLSRRRAGLLGSAAAALLFAAHPLCVESVAWISARKDLLAVGWMLAILLVEDGRDARRPSLVAVALFAAALLTKTSTVCIPIILFAWLVWLRGVSPRVAAVRAAPYALLSLAASIAVVTIWRGHHMIPSRPTSAVVDVLATLATYARRVVWPVDLSPIYPAAAPHAGIAAAACAAALLALGLAWRRLSGAARFAAVAFIAALLPVANIVPVAFRFADRYAILALAVLGPPAAIAFDLSLRSHGLRRWAVQGAFALALPLFARATIAQARVWHDSRALWARAAAAHPDAYLARLKYGETLRDDHEWPRATIEYQAAVRLRPDDPLAYVGLFYLYATRAELEGHFPEGTARRWLSELGPALSDERRWAALIAEVPHADCAACSNTLLLVELKRWPKPDETLRHAARLALDAGMPDAALVILSEARDHESPAWRDLWREAAPTSH